MITELGSMSIGTLCPSSLSAVASLLGQLQANLSGLLKVQAALTVSPPSLSANISGVAKVAASLALAVEGPSVTLQISAVASLIAQLQVQVSALVALMASLGTAGVAVYAFDGTASELGTQVSSVTSSGIVGGAPGDHANALVLATTIPATWLAMQQFFTTH